METKWIVLIIVLVILTAFYIWMLCIYNREVTILGITFSGEDVYRGTGRFLLVLLKILLCVFYFILQVIIIFFGGDEKKSSAKAQIKSYQHESVVNCGTCEYWQGQRVYDEKRSAIGIVSTMGMCTNKYSTHANTRRKFSSKCVWSYKKWDV